MTALSNKGPWSDPVACMRGIEEELRSFRLRRLGSYARPCLYSVRAFTQALIEGLDVINCCSITALFSGDVWRKRVWIVFLYMIMN